MKTWLRNVLRKLAGLQPINDADAKMAIEALPVTVNPATPELLKRHAGRLHRVMLALADGAHEAQREALLAERKLKTGFLAAHGYTVTSIEDVGALVEKLQ